MEEPEDAESCEERIVQGLAEETPVSGLHHCTRKEAPHLHPFANMHHSHIQLYTDNEQLEGVPSVQSACIVISEADSNIFHLWKMVKASKGLTTDAEVASFLLSV